MHPMISFSILFWAVTLMPRSINSSNSAISQRELAQYNYDLGLHSFSSCGFIAGDHYPSHRTGANVMFRTSMTTISPSPALFSNFKLDPQTNRPCVCSGRRHGLPFAVGLDRYTLGYVYSYTFFEHKVFLVFAPTYSHGQLPSCKSRSNELINQDYML